MIFLKKGLSFILYRKLTGDIFSKITVNLTELSKKRVTEFRSFIYPLNIN